MKHHYILFICFILLLSIFSFQINAKYDKSKKTKIVHYYLKNTPTDVLMQELGRAVPKVQQKIRNELVKRKVAV